MVYDVKVLWTRQHQKVSSKNLFYHFNCSSLLALMSCHPDVYFICILFAKDTLPSVPVFLTSLIFHFQHFHVLFSILTPLLLKQMIPLKGLQIFCFSIKLNITVYELIIFLFIFLCLLSNSKSTVCQIRESCIPNYSQID